MKNEDLKILFKILSLFKGYYKKMFYLLFCIIASTITGFVTPLLNRQLIDMGLQAKDINKVIIFASIIFLVTLIGQAIEMLGTKYELYINNMIPYDLSKIAFKRIFKLRIEYLVDTNYTQIMNSLNMDINNICRLVDRNSFFVVMQIFKMIAGVIGLITISWKLTILIVIIALFRFSIVRKLTRKRKYLFESYMDSLKEYSFWYGDTLAGIKEIKLLGIETIKIGEFIKRQRPMIKTNIKMLWSDKLYNLSEAVLLPLITFIIYILGTLALINGNLTLGGLFTFITYSMYVTGPISSILGLGYNLSGIIPSAKRYMQFLELECEGEGKVDLASNKEWKGIDFKNIAFKYSNGKTVLNDISFQIKAGERVAIIGANGSGKTTIVGLLLRFFKPLKGEILLNGINIEDIKLTQYRKLISVVSQDFYLFNTSVKNNINPRGKTCEEKIQNAAVQSGAHSFIGKMEERYDSSVGQNGMKLSGGERQKLALARALASDAKLIVLDEVTSSIDIESENQINYFIANSLKDKAILIISHKPSILEVVDKIIVLEDGVIKAMGTYTELLNRNILCKFLAKDENGTSALAN